MENSRSYLMILIQMKLKNFMKNELNQMIYLVNHCLHQGMY